LIISVGNDLDIMQVKGDLSTTVEMTS
jgi:hypothetical protein